MFEICSDLSKIGIKIYYFCQHSKKARKWPNGQTILFMLKILQKYPPNKLSTFDFFNFYFTTCFNSKQGHLQVSLHFELT